ncbi:MAG TPA: cyclopropane-fatty-acyl-phospholipid synthase family protein [Devosia sp.]|mgnify:CR=1 FL=1|jgi:cyclopropane-fatty-acyl-phospholipid synthase|nr:cyclopropane-fatty-acyl-phospholipid synthase family protein [Devosia sp.]
MDKLADVRSLRGPTLWDHVSSNIAAFFGERLIGRPKKGAVTITFPNGKTRTFGRPGTGEHPHLIVHKFSMVTETLRRGTVGFAHAYMRGDLEVDDLTALFRYFLQNRNEFQPKGAGWFGRAASDLAYHLSRANTIDGSKENISEHYDLGNAFYAEWLDPSMTYSSAVFESDDQALEAAQYAKYHAVADAAGVKQGDSVLEIGCGWGGFAETAARDYGASVYGITLSREQLAFAEQRIHRQGLDNLATFHFEDYRHTEGQFDHIASIEMIEAVGEEHWPSYFQTVADRLKPGGTAAIQAITINEADFDGYRSTPDFIQRYIFPGGMLLTKTAMREQAKRVGLALENVENFRLSYARTLALWRERFLERWHEIQKLGFDETFKRKWVYYLSYCEAGFAEGSIDVGIYSYSKPA